MTEPLLKSFETTQVFENESDVVGGLVLIGSEAFLPINGHPAGSMGAIPVDIAGDVEIQAKLLLLRKLEVASLDNLDEKVALDLPGLR